MVFDRAHTRTHTNAHIKTDTDADTRTGDKGASTRMRLEGAPSCLLFAFAPGPFVTSTRDASARTDKSEAGRSRGQSVRLARSYGHSTEMEGITAVTLTPQTHHFFSSGTRRACISQGFIQIPYVILVRMKPRDPRRSGALFLKRIPIIL